MAKPYASYKTSLLPFGRKIPSHWIESRLSRLFYRRCVQNCIGKELLSVFLDKGVVSYATTSQKQVHKPSEDMSKYQLVEFGDFVLNNQQAWRGSVGVSNYCGIVSPAYIVLRPFVPQDINPSFLNYMGRDLDIISQFVLASKGIGTIQRQISIPLLKQTIFAFPPRLEQDQIVQYLDWRCALIQKFVKAKRKEIRRLQELKKAIICDATMHGITAGVAMKNCSYPWIGQIPAAWTETRAKNVLIKLTRQVQPDDDFLICSNKGKVYFRGDTKIGLTSDSEDIYQGVRSGDLLIHGMDTWHGAIAVSDIDGKCTPVVHVCDSTQNKRYIAYYLQALAFKKVYKAISNGVRENTSDFRSWSKAGNILLVLPPVCEQGEIAGYLDGKCTIIDQFIEKLKAEISFVEEYRTRLISDLVTGKVDIRNIEIPDRQAYPNAEATKELDGDDADENTESEDEEWEVNEDGDND